MPGMCIPRCLPHVLPHVGLAWPASYRWWCAPTSMRAARARLGLGSHAGFMLDAPASRPVCVCVCACLHAGHAAEGYVAWCRWRPRWVVRLCTHPKQPCMSKHACMCARMRACWRWAGGRGGERAGTYRIMLVQTGGPDLLRLRCHVSEYESLSLNPASAVQRAATPFRPRSCVTRHPTPHAHNACAQVMTRCSTFWGAAAAHRWACQTAACRR